MNKISVTIVHLIILIVILCTVIPDVSNANDSLVKNDIPNLLTKLNELKKEGGISSEEYTFLKQSLIGRFTQGQSELYLHDKASVAAKNILKTLSDIIIGKSLDRKMQELREELLSNIGYKAHLEKDVVILSDFTAIYPAGGWVEARNFRINKVDGLNFDFKIDELRIHPPSREQKEMLASTGVIIAHYPIDIMAKNTCGNDSCRTEITVHIPDIIMIQLSLNTEGTRMLKRAVRNHGLLSDNELLSGILRAIRIGKSEIKVT